MKIEIDENMAVVIWKDEAYIMPAKHVAQFCELKSINPNRATFYANVPVLKAEDFDA